jgi:hypothetical protein
VRSVDRDEKRKDIPPIQIPTIKPTLFILSSPDAPSVEPEICGVGLAMTASVEKIVVKRWPSAEVPLDRNDSE